MHKINTYKAKLFNVWYCECPYFKVFSIKIIYFKNSPLKDKTGIDVPKKQSKVTGFEPEKKYKKVLVKTWCSLITKINPVYYIAL